MDANRPLRDIIHSTVRIECKTKEGISTGTGFFFTILTKNGKAVPCIVTNKHVIKGAEIGCLHLTRPKSDGIRELHDHYIYEVQDFESEFIAHPDSGVDLAILPLHDIYRDMEKRGEDFYHVMLSKKNIPSRSFFEKIPPMNDIIMIGYPNGLWDKRHNLPIIRKGITATHPNLPYCGKSEFMIDASCFPGSSGSPVFLSYTGSYIHPETGELRAGTNILIIGIQYAVYEHKATGEIRVIETPTAQKPISISSIPNNLGLVININRLLDFEDILSTDDYN